MSIDWNPPTLPDLRNVGVLSIDTEEKDDGLAADLGPGWPWRGGYVCGVSVAYRINGETHAHYFPLRHPDTENIDHDGMARWLKDHIAGGVKFITKNGLYDWGWLATDLSVTAASRTDGGSRRRRHDGRRESPQVLARRAVRMAQNSRQR
jgi:hypothetical protein